MQAFVFELEGADAHVIGHQTFARVGCPLCGAARVLLLFQILWHTVTDVVVVRLLLSLSVLTLGEIGFSVLVRNR